VHHGPDVILDDRTLCNVMDKDTFDTGMLQQLQHRIDQLFLNTGVLAHR